jgi:tRNA(His) 5'-end guanylyltransferase
MAKKETIGDRIKRYEAAADFRLPPRQPLLIRVDGKAFHTWTKSMTKPFDHVLMRAMRAAMCETAAQMQGFKLAYHQSDEVTFLLTDYDKFSTQGWFGYELNKVVSVAASTFTAWFNNYIDKTRDVVIAPSPAIFDARAFVVPQEDVPNVFLWRQRDWVRNSVQMLGFSQFSHKEVYGKNSDQVKEMLWAKKVIWDDLRDDEKWGSFLTADRTILNEKLDYYQIADLIKIPEDVEVDEDVMG